MMSKTTNFLFILILSVFSLNAAEAARITVIPTNPTSSDEIQIGFHSFGELGCIAKIPRQNPQGLTHYTENNGNTIELFIVGEPAINLITTPDCTIVPSGQPDVLYNIGSLPAGNYILSSYIVENSFNLPLTNTALARQYGNNISITVSPKNQSISSVPSTSLWGLLGVSLLLVLSALPYFRPKGAE